MGINALLIRCFSFWLRFVGVYFLLPALVYGCAITRTTIRSGSSGPTNISFWTPSTCSNNRGCGIRVDSASNGLIDDTLNGKLESESTNAFAAFRDASGAFGFTVTTIPIPLPQPSSSTGLADQFASFNKILNPSANETESRSIKYLLRASEQNLTSTFCPVNSFNLPVTSSLLLPQSNGALGPSNTVSFSSTAALSFARAALSFVSANSFRRCRSLIFPIHTIRGVAIAPITSPRIKARLAQSYKKDAQDSDGSMPMPPWFPLLAMGIIFVCGVLSLIATFKRRL
jgi:hypothetical protein